ncbi:hypothetical protein L208DRAFT_1281641 [Tricholoma matsutake]|nr:hypothetical protein L208DRAFT_1281641 [Tricholoma matsutake 945]
MTIAWCVPWPLSLSHAEPVSTRPLWRGKRITPTGIKAWLCNRGLHWSCFCALVSGSSYSTQIVQSAGDGKVYVFCSEYPSKCHFYLNLSEIYITATLESHYSHLFTLGKPVYNLLHRAELIMPLPPLLATFLLHHPDVVATGPYFQGHCGEHVSKYLLIQQKSGSKTIVRKMICSEALLGGMSILFILLIIYVNGLKQELHRLRD